MLNGPCMYATCITCQSFLLPFIKLVGKVLFELRDLVAEILPASPAVHVGRKMLVKSTMIVCRQRELIQSDEEVRREGEIVIGLLHWLTEHISAEDMDVEVVHGWVRVDP